MAHLIEINNGVASFVENGRKVPSSLIITFRQKNQKKQY